MTGSSPGVPVTPLLMDLQAAFTSLCPGRGSFVCQWQGLVHLSEELEV